MVNNFFIFTKNFVKKNTLLVRILISYIIIGMILLSVFSFLLIQTFSKNAIKETNSSTENMIYQSYNTADLLLSSTYTNFFNLYNSDPKIQNALYASNFSNLEAKDICDMLGSQAKLNPIITSIYIYNRKAGKVFTSFPSESDNTDFFDSGAIHIVDDFKDYKKNIIPREVTYKFLENTYNYKFITLIFYDYNRNFSIDSAMLINIDQNVFQRIVSSSKNNGINQLFIIDNSGIVISHTNPKMINSKLTNEPYVSKILSSKGKSGYFTDKVSGDTSLISYVKSDRLGWTFIGIGEYKNLLSNFEAVKSYVILITILFILIGIIVAAYFTTNIYKPIYKLLAEIKSKNEYNNKVLAMNEYDYLKTTFHSLVDNNTKLKSNINEYSSARKNELLFQLLNGGFSDSKNSTLLEQCDIKLNSNFYCVVIVKLDTFSKLSSIYSANDLALFKFAILKLSNEILDREFKIEGVDDGFEYVSLIIALKTDEPSSITTLKLLLEELHSYIQRYLKFTITSAIGNIVFNYESIHDSYKNALYAIGYRMIEGMNSIILYTNFAARKSLTQDYPFHIEKQLISSLRQRNEKKSLENLNDFFNYIKNNNYDEINMSISQLIMIIVRTFTNLESFNLESTGITFSSLHEGLKHLDTLTDIQEYIKVSLVKIINCKVNTGNNKKQEIINTIIEYLDINFHDSNISVEVLAENVELSVNYLRAIFKEAKNESISDYLIKLRIKKAEELLLTTEYTAKEISQMVGYVSTRYFYVVFKKFTGMTAEEYRNKP